MCTLAVIRSITVETRHKSHDGNWGAGRGFWRCANQNRDVFALVRLTMGVRHGDFSDGGIPERSGLEVDLLLAVERVPLDVFGVTFVGVVDVWETRNSVDHCSAAIVFRCLIGLAALLCVLGLLLEAGSHRQKLVCVFIRGRIVDVFLL